VLVEDAMEKTFKELLEQFENQNAELEAAFDQLRAMPADMQFALSGDVLGQLEDACAPRTCGTVNLLALRA
jgi:hypothetical protein